MRRVAVLTLVLVGLAACAREVSAYPVFFVRQELPCDAQPEKQYAQHSAPVPDSGISFVVADAGGKPVTSVCSGVNYTVTVTWGAKGDTRLALLTATAGNFTPSPPSGDGGCPNRLPLDRSGDFAPAEGQTVHLYLPCGTNESEPLLLQVSTTRGARSGFRQGSASLKWGSACSGCSGAASIARAAPVPKVAPLSKAPPPMAKVAPMVPVPPMAAAPPPIARVAPIPKVSFGRRRHY